MSRLPGTPRDPAGEDAELWEEMEAHLAHRVDDLVAGGMAPAEARRTAEAEFGDRARIRREVARVRAAGHRRGRVREALDALRQDLSFAARQLRRAPAFTATAVTTLALGIGAAVAIVSVVRAVVLEPLPFHEPERLVVMEMVTPAGADFSVSEPAFLEWREQLERYDGVTAFSGRGATLRAPGEPASVIRGYASAGFFPLLGVNLLAGRGFLPEEDLPGSAAAVAVLSESLWRARFGGSPEALGKTVDLDGFAFRVVGVYPDELSVLVGETDLITPLGASPAMDRGEHYLDVVGRMAGGVAPGLAREELQELAAWQSRTFEADRGWSARITPLEEDLIGTATIRAGWILLAAAGLLLLMACVNVSNLLLARATTRAREMGLRAALGAGTGRILRQLFTEAAVLALAAGGTGAVLAALAVPAIRSLGAGRIPRLSDAAVDPSALGAALGLAALATLLFGWVPALVVRRTRLVETGGARGGGSPGTRIRRALVMAQIAVSVVLLVGTGLLFRSFLHLSGVGVGFETEGRLAASLSMPDQSWHWTERGALLAGIEAAVAAVPGVEAVGATAVDPFSGLALANFVARNDRVPEDAALFTPIGWRPVTPGFFRAAGVEVVAGETFRDMDWSHDPQGPSPVVIDRRLSEILFDDPAEAVGAILVWGDPQGSRLRVTGVVEAVRDVSLSEDPSPLMYRLHQEIPWAAMTLVVHTRVASPALVQGIREAVTAAAAGMPAPEVAPLDASLDRALTQPRFNLLVLGSFAVLGLLLAVVGLYGLTAFEVRQRFREIGIRLSLGARPEAIRGMIVRERVKLTAVGIALGAGLAWAGSRLLESLLHGVTRADPLAWAAALTVLAVTAGLAAWLPARRATRVDPREVLNAD
ncbi:MAG TPA: ADOP family duplicated permease [Longimicrobiales bacterium]|nr:ADOP family duplicated permease [Longimicrobiales bacterium]